MKTIFLLAAVCLWLLPASARNIDRDFEKTVLNPNFKARTGSINTITKVELTDEHTKLFVHVVFRPHWWISADSTMYLEDVESGKRYQVNGVEGLKFGERFYMPDSGETDMVYTFPPLPDSVKAVNWIDPTSPEGHTYGIDLTKDGEGKQHSARLESWIAQHSRQATQPDDEENTDFFTTDTVYITGVLDNYDPVLGFETGIIYIRDMLENKDRPEVVKIHPDGRLEGKFLLKHPLQANMIIGDNHVLGNLYFEPGKTLALYLDFEDFLARSRARDLNYPLKHTLYGGELGEVNRQLAEAPAFPFDYAALQTMTDSLSPMQIREKYDQATAELENKLATYMDNNRISPKVRHILQMQAKVSGALGLLDYAMSYGFEQQRDTTKTELPMAFYSFLRQLPLDDETILAVKDGNTFINRFSFMGWLYQQASQRITAWQETHQQKVEPTPERQVEEMLLLDKARTEVMMDYLGTTDMPFLWQLVLCNSVCNTLLPQSANVTGERDAAEVQLATALKDSVSAWMTYPVLKETIGQAYHQYTEQQAYELPPGKGTDIFRRIIAPYKGKILLIDFWATSCGPCRSAIEGHADLRAKYRGNKDVQFIFITSESESPEQTYNAYVEKHLQGEAVYRIPTSDYQYLRELFSFNAIPRYVLIGRDGKVLSDDYRNMYSAHALEKDLKALGVALLEPVADDAEGT